MANRCLTVLLLVVASLVGCGDATVADPEPRFDGTYALTSVNGLALPVPLQPPAPGPPVVVLSGSLVVAQGGAYTISSIWDEVETDVMIRRSIRCDGTWVRSDTAFTFVEFTTASCGGGYTGTWDGADRFTVALAPGLEAVFER